MTNVIPPTLARSALSRGAIGIGEKHDKDDGRKFTCDLLNEGSVRALFLEGKSQTQYVIEGAKEIRRQGGSLVQIATESLGITAPEYGAKINVGHVAALAIWRDVPVYCIDVYASEYGDPWLKDGMQEAVQIRDKNAADLFKRCVHTWHNKDRTGCLVLFGAAHFTGTNGRWEKQHCLADYLQLDYVLFE